MENSGAALAAAVEATVFLGYFNEMPDHRQAGKVAYPLDEVLLLALMAVLAGAEGFTDIARFVFGHPRPLFDELGVQSLNQGPRQGLPGGVTVLSA